MTRPQQGRPHRLTGPQIERVRSVYARLTEARREREQLQRQYGLSQTEFWSVAVGNTGKKPRVAA